MEWNQIRAYHIHIFSVSFNAWTHMRLDDTRNEIGRYRKPKRLIIKQKLGIRMVFAGVNEEICHIA